MPSYFICSFLCFVHNIINIWSCQVRASAVFALGNLLDMGSTSSNGVDDDSDDDEKIKAEINVIRSLLQVSSDGSPLVRCEVAIGMCIRKNISVFIGHPFIVLNIEYSFESF